MYAIRSYYGVYGMGERPIVEIARRLAAGEDATALRDMRGVAYLLGKKEALPDHRFDANCPGTGGIGRDDFFEGVGVDAVITSYSIHYTKLYEPPI